MQHFHLLSPTYHCAHPRLKIWQCLAAATACWAILEELSPVGTSANDATPPPTPPAPIQGPLLVSVTTGLELQQAIRDHVRHIVINEHLDLTRLPIFSENTITSTAVGVIRGGTDSIRVCPFPMILPIFLWNLLHAWLLRCLSSSYLHPGHRLFEMQDALLIPVGTFRFTLLP